MTAEVNTIASMTLLPQRGAPSSLDRAPRLAMPGGHRRGQEASAEGDLACRVKENMTVPRGRLQTTQDDADTNGKQNMPA